MVTWQNSRSFRNRIETDDAGVRMSVQDFLDRSDFLEPALEHSLLDFLHSRDSGLPLPSDSLSECDIDPVQNKVKESERKVVGKVR